MPYWIYGHDRETGEAAELFSETANEEEARTQATDQGIVVERIEQHTMTADEAASRPMSPFTTTPAPPNTLVVKPDPQKTTQKDSDPDWTPLQVFKVGCGLIGVLILGLLIKDLILQSIAEENANRQMENLRKQFPSRNPARR